MSFVFGNVEIFIIKKRQSEEIILSCSHVIVQVYRADIFRRFEFRSWSWSDSAKIDHAFILDLCENRVRFTRIMFLRFSM